MELINRDSSKQRATSLTIFPRNDFMDQIKILAFLVTMNGQKIRTVNVTQTDCVTFAKIALSLAAQRKSRFSSGRLSLLFLVGDNFPI